METENNNQKLTPAQAAQVCVTLAFAAYGAYQLGGQVGRAVATKLHEIKNRKNDL